MEKLKFDSGVKSYDLGCGVLRFNPSDPNLYDRFLAAADKMEALETQLLEQARQAGQEGREVVKLLTQIDRQMKQILQEVFTGNDFDALLGGVNLLAMAGNGQRVVTNLMQALQPVLLKGAEDCVREKTDAAVKKAVKRRESL